MTAHRNPQFVVIEQQITAGSDWDGTVPTTDPDYTTVGVKIFPEDVGGGKFEFDFTSFFLTEVQQISVDFGGVAVKSIVIRRASGPDVLLFDSTDALETNILITDRIQLASDEYITIVSTGAVAAMFARVIVRPLHPAPSTSLSF